LHFLSHNTNKIMIILHIDMPLAKSVYCRKKRLTSLPNML
jgi:hypothetical protein